MRYGFGIDVGGTTVKLAYFNENGEMLKAWQIPTVTEGGGVQILPDIARSVTDFLEQEQADRSRIIGIGVCVPGPVDSKGVVNRCVNLGWGVFNIAQALQALTGFPVVAGNDANVAAMGEYWKGGGAGYKNMVMATLGTGLGGGIVLGGQLLHGAHGSGGEIGHMCLNPYEKAVCGCGKRGCAEQYIAAPGLARIAREHLAESDSPSLLRQVEKPVSKDIFDAAKAGDTLAMAVLEDYYHYLGLFLGSLCSALDPEVVVLGGGVSKAGQMLLDGIRPHFEKHVFHGTRETQLTIAKLGNDAGAYGAFKLALDAFGGLDS